MSLQTTNGKKYTELFINNLTKILRITEKEIASTLITNPKLVSKLSDVPGLISVALSYITSLDDNSIQDFMLKFIEKGYRNLSAIKNKEQNILLQELDIILPDNPYIEKIQYMFGNNPERKQYCSDKAISAVWNMIHALVHLSVKHIITNNIQPWKNQILSDRIIEQWEIQFS